MSRWELDRYPEAGEYVKRTIGDNWFIVKILGVKDERYEGNYHHINCKVMRVSDYELIPSEAVWDGFLIWKDWPLVCSDTHHTEILSEDEVMAELI